MWICVLRAVRGRPECVTHRPPGAAAWPGALGWAASAACAKQSDVKENVNFEYSNTYAFLATHDVGRCKRHSAESLSPRESCSQGNQIAVATRSCDEKLDALCRCLVPGQTSPPRDAAMGWLGLASTHSNQAAGDCHPEISSLSCALSSQGGVTHLNVTVFPVVTESVFEVPVDGGLETLLPHRLLSPAQPCKTSSPARSKGVLSRIVLREHIQMSHYCFVTLLLAIRGY